MRWIVAAAISPLLEHVAAAAAAAATAATTALLENNPKEAKTMLLDSFKRSGHKSKDIVKRIAKDKLDQVLTGRGARKRKYKRVLRLRHLKKHRTLLDM